MYNTFDYYSALYNMYTVYLHIDNINYIISELMINDKPLSLD